MNIAGALTPGHAGQLLRWGWISVFGSLLVFGATSGPHFFDAGELIAAAWQLGGSHPPGQPLHALLAHAVALVPVGPISWRVALLSVGCALGTARVAGVIVEREFLSDACSREGWIPALAPELASVGVLLAPTLMRQSNRPEVYALSLLLALLSIQQLLAWRRAQTPAMLLRAALWAGLCASVHLPHAMACVSVGLALAFTSFRALTLQWRSSCSALALSSLVFAAAALATALYLPSRALAGAPMWGDPTTLTGFWDYLSARAYHMNLSGSSASNWGAWPLLATWVGGAGLLAIAGGVWACAEKTLRPLGIAALAALLPAAVTAIVPTNPDTVAYLGPGVSLTIVLAILGWTKLPPLLDRALSSTGQPAYASMALGAVWILLTGTATHPFAWAQRHIEFDRQAPPLAFFTALATTLPDPRSLVVVESDLLAASWMLRQQSEEARPDVRVFVRGLSTSSWHWKSLEGHPAFDGTPSRQGPGDPYQQYTTGAISRAFPLVDVHAETRRSAPGIFGPPPQSTVPLPVVSPSGLYLRTSRTAAPDANAVPEPIEATLLNALEAALTSDPSSAQLELCSGARCDAQLPQLAIREVFLRRAGWFFAQGHVLLGRDALRKALPASSAIAREGVTGLHADDRVAQPPARSVVDPVPLGRSAADAVRSTAVWLDAFGRGREAVRILAELSEQGDARAPLQLAWIEFRHGRVSAAKAALGAVPPSARDHQFAELNHLLQGKP